MNDELHSLRAIDEILARHDVDEVRRMLGWLTDKYVSPAVRVPAASGLSEESSGAAGSRADRRIGSDTDSHAGSCTDSLAGSRTGSPGETGIGTFDMTSAPSGAAPVVPVGIADVDFAPEGKPDAKGYNDVWGSPDDDRVKCLEAVHWFEAVGEVPAVTPEHVHAYFVEKGWEVPDDLIDTIGRAGAKGYLAADEPTDLRVAPKGHRLMDSSLSYVDP